MHYILNHNVKNNNYHFNLIAYELITFSGGEPHVVINDRVLRDLDSTDTITIHSILNNGNSLVELMCIVDALRQALFRRGILPHINLKLGYMPGGRQDRYQYGSAFTLQVYSDFINSLMFNRVEVLHPHSDVTAALLDNSIVKSLSADMYRRAIELNPTPTGVIIPDAGAAKDTYKWLKDLWTAPDAVVQCTKQRDMTTGKLSGFNVPDVELPEHCVIVDDICDGGGTFLGLGTILKERGVKRLSLCVSHGIFSKGVLELKKVFDTIITTDSWNHNELTLRNVEIVNFY